MGRVNCVILGGRPFVTKEERRIVVHLIMLPRKFYKVHNMTCLLTFGAWALWRINYSLEKLHFTISKSNKLKKES